MLELLTDLTTIQRMELDVEDTDVLVSGLQGRWVTFNANGKADLTVAATDVGFCVWTESNRDGTLGFTPDTGVTSKVTVLYGKYKATTDCYTGSPVIGSALIPGTYGILAVGTVGSTDKIVGYCIKAPYSYTYLGTTYTVIDFVTV